MQPLPYDNGKSLVRGLDTLVTLFNTSDTGLISSQIEANPLKEQREYLEEVRARIIHARSLTKNFLESFDTTNPKQVHAKFRMLRAGLGETPRVKGVVDMEYCVGFVEARKKVKDYYGKVYANTYARKFALPHQAQIVINTAIEQSALDSSKAKYMKFLIDQQAKPLEFVICDKKVHEVHRKHTPEVLLLSAIHRHDIWDSHFQCTAQHEARHIQDVILGTFDIVLPGLPLFQETSAHLYADKSFRGLHVTRTEFKENINNRRIALESRLKFSDFLIMLQKNAMSAGVSNTDNETTKEGPNDYMRNQRTLHYELINQESELNQNEKEGGEIICKTIEIIQAIPNEQRRAIWPHARALSYVFSTANQREVVDRFALALQEYKTRCN